MDDNHRGHACECPSSCDEILNDPKFEVSSKGKEYFDEYEINNEDISIQFSNEKVCATNGLPYESECHMRIAACNQQQHLDVANIGECGKLWGTALHVVLTVLPQLRIINLVIQLIDSTHVAINIACIRVLRICEMISFICYI